MTFPAAVPEIPVASVDEAAAYYVKTLGFTFGWGDEAGGIAGVFRGKCRLFITNRSFRESYGNTGPVLFWLNLEGKAQVDALFAEWKAAQARMFPSPRTSRGSCANLWPPIWMATSFASSTISVGINSHPTCTRPVSILFNCPHAANTSRPLGFLTKHGIARRTIA
jgi:hypothetical protein